MGKSDKKIKSERVNALRKQYDVFLEEDKKRRERNEFILGRLDKMRMSTALVLRHNPIAGPKITIGQNTQNVRRPNILYQNEYDALPAVHRCLIPVMPQNTSIDEQLLLRQISKKYILIPKLDHTAISPEQAVDVENSMPQDNNNPFDIENDWRSKYEILSQLKKSEKESNCDVKGGLQIAHLDKRQEIQNSLHEDLNVKERHLFNNNAQLHGISPSLPLFQYDVPEKDTSNDQNQHSRDGNVLKDLEISSTFDVKEDTNVRLKDIPIANSFPDKVYQIHLEDTINDNISPVVKESEIKFCDVLLTKSKQEPIDEVNFTKRVESPIENGPKTANKIEENEITSNNATFRQYEDEIIGKDEENCNMPDNTGVQPDEIVNLSNFAEDLKLSDNAKNINQEPTQMENENKVMYSTEIKNEHDLSVTNNVTAVYENYENQLDHEQRDAIQDNYDNLYQYNPENPPVDESNTGEAIEAFDQENQEMFYSEQQHVNYDTYNQPGEEGGYQSEYPTNPDGYDKNQYEYEGTQEVVYPTEYLENEELQQYDQSYEQQYGNNEITQPQEGFEPVTQNEQEQLYDEPAQYEQLQYEQQIPLDQLEQQLAQEEGYIDLNETANVEVTEIIHGDNAIAPTINT